MHVLVTGGGFVGQWTARALLARGDTVDFAGLGDRITAPLLSAEERDAVRWIPADFRDATEVDRAVELSKPDVVLHLAGVSFPPDAERSPGLAYDINALGVVRLLAAIQKRRAAGTIDPVVLVVGSGVQYGPHEGSEMPLAETAEQRPTTIYAAAKAAQEIAALQFFRGNGARVICTRSFNHSGVGHSGQYLLPSLVERVSRIVRGTPGPLTIGNDVVRDYLHVSDAVSAYLSLVERGTAGEVYNVASGRGVSTRQLANDVLSRAGVTADISTEPALMRASDIRTLVGSPAKLHRDTGWTPAKTHTDIIDDLLHSANAPTD